MDDVELEVVGEDRDAEEQHHAPPRLSRSLEICDSCGAGVGDWMAHNRWHQRIDALVKSRDS